MPRRKKSAKVPQQPKNKKTVQRLVRNDKVALRKSQGWKVVAEDPSNERDKVLDIRTHISDLTLMKKEV